MHILTVEELGTSFLGERPFDVAAPLRWGVTVLPPSENELDRITGFSGFRACLEQSFDHSDRWPPLFICNGHMGQNPFFVFP